MNDSGNILHQHRGPYETAAPSHYPDQLRPAQIPRGIEDQPQPLRVDGSQGRMQVHPEDAYHGLASGNSSDGLQQSDSYVSGPRESGIQLSEIARVGLGQSSVGSHADSHEELYDNSVYVSLGHKQHAGGRQQIESENLVTQEQIHGSPLMSPRVNPPQTISGQKRNAVGDIKSPSADVVAPPASGVDGSARYRSRSISSASHESRIAALSVQLRTRLSHAAAKVEKNWQSRSKSPLQMLQGASPALSSAETGRPLNAGVGLDDPPDGTTASAPNRSAAYSSHPLNGLARPPEILPPHPDSRSVQSISQSSPRKSLQAPKLAPPVDIIAGWGSGRRRRPNPNEWAQPPQSNPASRHCRHHSQLEFGASKPYPEYDSHAMSGTPSLRPPEYSISTPYSDHSRIQTDSRNLSMEQDAVETLLFMSSPENSGYRSNTRQRQNTIPNSIGSSMGSGSSAASNQAQFFNGCIGSSASEMHAQSRHNGLEAQAGDEIDRMLDQMGDSDSEDEKTSASAHSRSHKAPTNYPRRRNNGLSGQ